MIDDYKLISKCTLVEADCSEAEYEGNTYKLNSFGAVVKYLDSIEIENALEDLENKFNREFLKTADILIIDTIEENINNTILLSKKNIIKVKENESILCNSITAKKLDYYGIDSTNLIIVECMEDNIAYILDLKNVLFLYNRTLFIKDLKECEEKVSGLIQTGFMNFCFDKNKIHSRTKITKVKLKE